MQFVFIAILIVCSFFGSVVGHWLGRRTKSRLTLTASAGTVNRDDVDRIVDRKQAELVAELVAAMKSS